MERVLGMATRFLDEVRGDVERAAEAGSDLPPRLRAVHEHPGHATPEYRTLAIPIPAGVAGAPPEILSGVIARYAATKRPDVLVLTLDAEMEREDGTRGPVLIAEARCRFGTRLFWVQPYDVRDRRVQWGPPAGGGWQDPGDEDMILDGSFEREPAVTVVGAGRRVETAG